MTDNTMKKVGQTENYLYGPRKILLCGYSPNELNHFQNILKETQLPNIMLITANIESLSNELKELFLQKDQSGFNGDSEMQRAAIMAGITEKELHSIINAYRSSGLPKQFWAALTPVSENWTLEVLLEELKKENEAIRKQRLAKT